MVSLCLLSPGRLVEGRLVLGERAVKPSYQCECPSIEALVQRVVNLSGKGYFHFFQGQVPAGKPPELVDEKMVEKYAIESYGVRALSKAARSRRKGRGLANIDYFRFRYGFLVMATDGAVVARSDDIDSFGDIREEPVVFGDYRVQVTRVGYGRGGAVNAKVRTELVDVAFRHLRREFLRVATSPNAERLEAAFFYLPYNPYEGIRRQLRSILDEMNQRRRRAAGRRPLSPGCIRFKRELPEHFGPVEGAGERAA